MQKIGLYYFYGKPKGSTGQVGVRHTEDNRYTITDPEGRRIALCRQDAVVAHLALGVALRMAK